MDIVKSLNLNKSPKNVPNGSLVFAKNIKLSSDTSFITDEEGLYNAIGEEITNNIEGTIVGIIPYDKGIIVFSVFANQYRREDHVYIFREQENSRALLKTEYEHHNWISCNHQEHYKNIVFDTRLTGTYTYNVNHELIVTVAEHPINSEYYNKYDIPLRVCNFDKLESVVEDGVTIEKLVFYDVSSDLPICNMVFKGYKSGQSIPNGTYQFFIRYKIDNDYYSNWFPIGSPKYGLYLKEETLINNQYAPLFTVPDYSQTAMLERKKFHLKLSTKINNTDIDSNNSFDFELKFYLCGKINECQIGYLLQKEDGIVGRAGSKFKIDPDDNDQATVKFTFTTEGFEEEDVNAFLENNFSIYNVKNLCNYNNRVYIGNYKETNFNELTDDLRTSASNINIQNDFLSTPISDVSSSTGVGGKGISISDGHNTYFESSTLLLTDTQRNPVWTHRLGNDYDQLVKIINDNLYFNHNVDTDRLPINVINTVWEYGRYEERDEEVIIKDANGNITGKQVTKKQVWVKDNSNPSPASGNNIFVVFDYTNNATSPSINFKTNGGLTQACYIKTEGTKQYIYFGAKLTISGSTVNVVDYIARLDRSSIIAKETTLTESNKSAAKHFSAVGTFMPLETYRFFVHYVRKDGSYTNGIPVGNNNGEFTFGTGITQQTMSSIRVKFTNISIPDEYVGVFFSYEKTSDSISYMACCVGPASLTNVQPNSDDIIPGYQESESWSLTKEYKKKYGRDATYQNVGLFKSTEVEIAINQYAAIQYFPLYQVNDNGSINGAVYADPVWHNVDDASILPSNSISSTQDGDDINTTGMHGGIVLKINNYTFKNNEVGIIRASNNNDYRFNKQNKDLIRLTDVIYNSNVCADVSSDPLLNNFNYPAYIVNDNVLVYTCPIAIDEATGYVKVIDQRYNAIRDNIREDYAKIVTFKKYSKFNLNAISFKKKPDILASPLEVQNMSEEITEVDSKFIYTNYIIYPLNLTDLFKLESNYIVENYKTFTNYDENLNYPENKTNTIRRSEIIRDESTQNSWRVYKANQYKELNTNKGKITNLVNIGSILLIHTENSIFIMDASNKLVTQDKEVQLMTPDMFDLEPMELLTGTHGYGGLQTLDSWCINHHGYWYYDRDDLKLYNIDGNHKLTEFGFDITRLIEEKKPITIKFGTDFENNRIIACLELENNKFITLSYNYIVNKWISFHDYFFTDAYNTKNRVYFFCNRLLQININNNVIDINGGIYTFGKYIGYYSAIRLPGNKIPGSNPEDYYSTNLYPSHFTKADIKDINGNNIINAQVNWSFVDIIFNPNTELSKEIDSVRWKVNTINSYDCNDNDRQAEEELGNDTLNDVVHYSGDFIQLYSDMCNSGILDISVSDKVNKLNDYKHPYYDKGCWNFNYFRNHIVDILTDDELKDIAKKLLGATDENVNRAIEILKRGLIEIPVAGGNIVYRYSDYRQLVYGTYFVIRFIFSPHGLNHIKFETVSPNIKEY